MKPYLLPLCAAFAALTLLAADPTTTRVSVSPEEADRVLTTAFSRGAALYRNYRGVESLRHEIIREYDPASKKLTSTSEVTTRRKEYYYEMPEIEVTSYKKEGVQMNPSTFRVWKAMPLYPVFDERGRERYEFRITDRKKIGGRRCYRVQVIPKQETYRHFKGNIYLAVGTLESVSLEGTMAKLDFPLREFHIELGLTHLNDVPVAKNGAVHIRVKVPVFYPDTIIESTLTVMENKLIR